MIAYGIHCNFFIVLPIRLKTCRSNGFFFYKAKCARPKNGARLRGLARLSAVDWHQARKLSRPVRNTQYSTQQKTVGSKLFWPKSILKSNFQVIMILLKSKL